MSVRVPDYGSAQSVSGSPQVWRHSPNRLARSIVFGLAAYLNLRCQKEIRLNSNEPMSSSFVFANRHLVVTLFAVVLVCFAPVISSAQVPITGTLQCQSESSTRVAIGSRGDSFFEVEELNCVWTQPIKFKDQETEKEVWQVFREIRGKRSRERGNTLGTLKNGDKYRIRWQQRSRWSTDSRTLVGTWWFTEGTGAADAIEGGGTFKREIGDDGLIIKIKGKYRFRRKRQSWTDKTHWQESNL